MTTEKLKLDYKTQT